MRHLSLFLLYNECIENLSTKHKSRQEHNKKVGYYIDGRNDCMNWLKTLNDALEYVEEHIDEEIDVQDITKMVHSSYHHFVRTFHILSGVTLVEYIRKRRLTLAANDLVGSNVKVIDIAYKYQYSTPESFSKAFKEFHGVSPRDAKNFKGGLKSYSKLSFKIQIGGISEMTYKMVHKDVLEFSGYVIEVETKNGQNFIDIPAFWQSVFKDGRFPVLLENSDEMGVVGVCYGYDKEISRFKYMIGVRNSNVTAEGIEHVTFGPEDFAAFKCEGKLPDSVQKTVKYIYNEWFPSSNYEHTSGPEIEVYPGGDTASDDYVCYYWMPVQKK